MHSALWMALLGLPLNAAQAQGRKAVGPSQTAATKAYYPIPVQHYAVLDASGDDPANSPVSGVALRDDNQLAFSVSKQDEQGGTVAVKKWLDGNVTAGETLRLEELSYTYREDGGRELYHSISREVKHDLMSADGALCGTTTERWYGPGPQLPRPGINPASGPRDQNSVQIEQTLSAFSAAGSGPSLIPPFSIPSGFMGHPYHTRLVDSSSSGASIYMVTNKTNGYGGLLVLSPNATATPATLFYAYPTAPVNRPDLKVVTQSGYEGEGGWAETYNLVNSKGWALLDESKTLLWNGQQAIKLPDRCVGLNESNDVLIANQDWDHPERTGIYRKGGEFVPFFTQGEKRGMIPEQFQRQVIVHAASLSNRLALPATPAKPVLHIMCSGWILRPSGEWEVTSFVLREWSDGSTDLRESPLPWTISAYGVKMNANGVLAYVGDPQNNVGPLALRHALSLLPMDIDFVHPVTGEMDESREQSDGGYIPIRKDDETPVTKLRLHKLNTMPSTQSKVVFGPAKIKIWKDAERTQAVTSNQTTFPANVDTELFFEGVEKSASAKDVEIGLKIVIGSTESSAVTAKATVVQSEFPLILRAFIPYKWTQPSISPAAYTIAAEGDNRGLVLNDGPFSVVPFRCRQKIIITPYADLNAQTDLVDQRAIAPRDVTAPLSRHYDKNVAVPLSERSGIHGFSLVNGVPPKETGVPQVETLKYDFKLRASSRDVTYRLEVSAEDGAMSWYIPTPNIDWKYDIKVDCTDPAKPKVNVKGERDGFPAYEILVIASDGTLKDIYYWRPPVQVQVGLGSLNTTTSINQTLEVP